MTCGNLFLLTLDPSLEKTREQNTTMLCFPRGRRSGLQNPLSKKSHSFLHKQQPTQPATIPKNIASFPQPSKDEIISK